MLRRLMSKWWAKRDRTADLLHAMQALSQLSYGPSETPDDLPGAESVLKLASPRDSNPGRHRERVMS